MTSIKKTIVLVSALMIAIVLSMGIQSCKKITNPTEGTKLIINYDLMRTNISLEFYDAQTGILIGQADDKRVKVEVMGEAAEAVLDLSGQHKESYLSSQGLISLALNPNAEYTPSESNPLRVSFVASLEGYISTSQQLTVTKDGNYKLKFFMVDRENPPTGVSIKTEWNVGSLVSGILQETLIVETPGGEAKFVIPAGTRITDADGTILNASLNIMLAYFSNLEDASLAAFPGGLVTRVLQDGQYEDGAFFSAGFVAIEVWDATGRDAKYFQENKAELIVQVDAQTYNPETESTIALDDVLPLYSYAADSGSWMHEQDVVVESGVGAYAVTAEMDHLSYWNFDWFWSYYCYEGLSLKFTGDFACECMWFDGIIRKSADDTYLASVSVFACKDESVQLLNVPKNMPVYIEWSGTGDPCSTCYVDGSANPLPIFNLCSNTTVDVPVICATQGHEVVFDLVGYCVNNANVEIRPTFGVWLRPVDNFCWQWVYMQDGLASVCNMIEGQNYIIGMYVGGNWHETVVLIDDSETIYVDIEFPDEFCSQGF